MLANILSRYWWMTLIRGALWVLFGLFIFAQPGISLVTLTFTFGIFALMDGVGCIVNAVGGRDEHEHWWLMLLAGIAGVLVGVLTFISPQTTALVLLLYVAGWALATGFLQVVSAIRLRKEIEGEFWLALSGVLTMAFGVLLLTRPAAGALSVLWIIAVYAIAFGALLIGLAFRVRGFANRVGAAFKM
jgi:uncharacterized membrane protein HdeD (DUF308 family)